MKALERTLAILACLFLVVQTVRHAYILWLQPRASVLDKYDSPLKDEIAAAKSLEELVARYDPLRKEVDRAKAQRRQTKEEISYSELHEEEPFRSEASVREAIQSWEGRAREVHSLRFYWLVGFSLVALGTGVYLRLNRWAGLALIITGFSEIVYWTSPTLLGGGVKEFDRLLTNKVVLSATALAMLGVVIRILGPFSETTRSGE